MGFWLGAILLTVGTPFAVVGLSGAHAEWRFSNDARAVEGIVLTKESRRSGRSNRRSGHAATYRFVIAGRTFEGRTPLRRDVWGELVERQPATVRYLPYAPSTSRLDGARPWRGLLVMAVIGSLFTAIGARVFMRSVRSARLEWRLRRHGHATRGTVIEVRDRHLKINGVTQWRLLFEYDDAGGRRHGGAHDVAEDEALEWKVGDAGDVRYDPVSPSSAIWLGKAQPFFGERP
jgi:hypothetical protein